MRAKGILAIVAFLVCATSGGLAAWAAGSGEVVGLRRLSEQEYRNSVADIFGKDIVVQGMFEPEVRMGGLVAASTAVLSMTQPGFESFSKMADSIAVQVTGANSGAGWCLAPLSLPRTRTMHVRRTSSAITVLCCSAVR